MNQVVIVKGNCAVVINVGEARVWACLYVNARNGLAHADITNLAWRGNTLAGAKRWAEKQLALAS